MDIWNEEIIGNKIFPGKLKLADISPIFKKLERTLKLNYRPVSVLPAVSKIFERLMHLEMSEHIECYLSKYLCGFRTGFNTQHAILSLIEKWKKVLIIMDLLVPLLWTCRKLSTPLTTNF